MTAIPAARIGLELTDWLSFSARLDAAKRAESQGFDDVVMAEIGDPDVFVTAALVLDSTSRIRFGTCVVQIGPRTIPMLAASAATLSSMFPGRFALGVGVSSKAIVEGWHGVAWTNPIARAQESVALLHSLLRGERANAAGSEVRSKGFRLNSAPEQPPPVHLAALNESMLRLAAKTAEGVWLNFVPRSRARDVVAIIRDEATQAARAQPEILLSLACYLTDDIETAQGQVRDMLMFYVASPAYRRFWSCHGFEGEMAAAELALEARDKNALHTAITTQLIGSVALIGNSSAIREQLAQYRDAGITTLCLGPADPSSLRFVLEETPL